MDEFLEKLVLQLNVMDTRQRQYDQFLSRVLDAKESILNIEHVEENDAVMINRMLDDHLKLTAIIKDYQTSYNRFLQKHCSDGRL